jgi:hypothetical protein
VLKTYGRVARVVVPLLGALLAPFAPFLTQRAISPSEVNPIVAENRLQGSDGWRLGRAGFSVSDDAVGQIKGYASSASVNHGEKLVLHVSVQPVQTYSVDVFRMGWYAGKGGRLLQHLGPLPGAHQAACPNDRATGLIACRWTPSTTVDVARNWTSGFYMAVLTNSQNYQSYVPFVVRDDDNAADFVYKEPVNTYEAYNNYPDDHQIGKSLYDQNSYGPNTVADKPRAVKASFDRPYNGDGAGQFFEWEFSLLQWLERSGYDIDYVTDVDLHNAPGILRGRKGVIDAGHDEYWSRQMYDAVTSARDAGVNLAFFGADVGDWQIRYEAGAGGEQNRTIVCYRDVTLDPEPQEQLKTVWWRDPPLNRPPQALVGVQLQYLLTTNAPLVATNTDYWVFANSGFHQSDAVPGIVGYEVDSAMPGFALPPSGGTYTLLSSSPVTDQTGRPGVSNSSIYRASSGAWVFATGTMSWSWGLDPERAYDSRVQQVSANVLNTFLTGVPPAAEVSLQAGLSAYEQLVLSQHPLAYWPLGDSDTPVARDLSGAYRVGVVVGGITLADHGSHSDGSGRVALSPLPTVGDFSIEGWSRIDDATWNSNVFYDNTLYGLDGHVRILARPGASAPINTDAYLGVWLNGKEYALQPSHEGIDHTGQWVYWALVRQGGRLTAFRNGDRVAQRDDLPADATADVSGSIFLQGQTLPLKGAVSDVAVYGVALSANDVHAHYEAGSR